MCILFIYQNPNPSSNSYRLVLISNRDEYYARPAKLAHYWKDYPGCLGGTDMEPGREGGTWLALNKNTFRIGVILNLNGEPKSVEGKGRGFLIRDYITTPKSTLTHAIDLHKVNQETQCYNPYDLVMVDIKANDIYYLSSKRNFTGPVTVNETILAFGNGGIETPYKKVLAGKEKFKQIIASSSRTQENVLIENLIHLLKLEEKYLPDEELQKRSPEAVNELSSIFVQHTKAKYGTRTHTIIFVDYYFQITFVEESLDSSGIWKRQVFKD